MFLLFILTDCAYTNKPFFFFHEKEPAMGKRSQFYIYILPQILGWYINQTIANTWLGKRIKNDKYILYVSFINIYYPRVTCSGVKLQISRTTVRITR